MTVRSLLQHISSLCYRMLVATVALSAGSAATAQSCKALDPALTASYTGGCLKGLAHGSGTAVGTWGDSYTGMWANGLKHGRGKYIFSNGSTFVGQFVNDLPVTDETRFSNLRAAGDPNWRIVKARRDPQLTALLQESQRTGGSVPIEAAISALQLGDYAQAYGLVMSAAEKGSILATLALAEYWDTFGYDSHEHRRYLEAAGKLGNADAAAGKLGNADAYRHLASRYSGFSRAAGSRYEALARDAEAKERNQRPAAANAAQGSPSRPSPPSTPLKANEGRDNQHAVRAQSTAEPVKPLRAAASETPNPGVRVQGDTKDTAARERPIALTVVDETSSDLKWKICMAQQSDNNTQSFWTAPMYEATELRQRVLQDAFQVHLRERRGANFFISDFSCISERSMRSVLAEKEKVLYVNREMKQYKHENVVNTEWVYPAWAATAANEKRSTSPGSAQENGSQQEAAREARRKALQDKIDSDRETLKADFAAARARAEQELAEHKARCAARGIPEDKCPGRGSAQ